jgi:hypothetical protein
VSSPILILVAATAVFLLNLPFGYWRAGLGKFSAAWFVAIHAPVPLVVALRWGLGLPFSWSTLPWFVAAYFGGQWAGARLRQHRQRARGA